MKDQLKFAVAGCGFIGQRYIQILSNHPYIRLNALIDTNIEFCKESGGKCIPTFSSLDEFLTSDTDTDVLVIATPNGTHSPFAIKALKAKKHVLIEKPMALKKSDAECIVRVSKEMNRKAMVVLQNRFSPVSVWLKQMVTSGRLGRLFFAEVNCFWNRDERYYKKGSWHGTLEMDGGTLFTQFSHFIDMLYWLFGDIRNICSRFQNFNHKHLACFEDTGSIHFEFEQGGIGTFSFTTATWEKTMESSLTIISERGTLKISGQYLDKVEYCHIKDYDTSPEKMETSDISIANHRKTIDAMITAVREDTSTNINDAVYSIDMIERMYSAAPY